ncbi:hypothetical protein BH23GEM6_BH23GEM6_05900 [soil metagenome]
MKKLWVPAISVALLCSPASAQDTGLAAACQQPEISAEAREICVAAAQGVASAQPQFGILLAGGNPTPGVAGAAGLRLGFLLRTSVTGKVNLALIRLPDLLADATAQTGRQLNRTVGIPAPALSATGSVGLFPGFDAAPMIRGIGAVDLLGSATWLPLRLLGVEGVEQGSSQLATAGGVRIGFLRESFAAPGLSTSLMYRKLGQLAYGDVCPAPAQTESREVRGSTFEYGSCAGPGDAGEFSLDLTNWSTRVVASRRLLGLGFAGGLGYDRFVSNVSTGFRQPTGEASSFGRIHDQELTSDRWSGFVNASLSAVLTSFVAEVGWMQGAAAIPGYSETRGGFDPATGTFFGSLGLRLAF